MSEEKDLTTDLAIRYIAENYTPVGDSEKKDYVTSADIVRELSEMITISIAQNLSQVNPIGSFTINRIERAAG